jgi:aspartyl protease family protein
MLRKLIILGIFAGTSASVPVLYQANPEAFHSILRSANEEAPAKSPAAVAKTSMPATETLQGRKVAIHPDARGHFSAEFKLNGRKVNGMIDTGATLIAINLSTARKAGIALQQSDFRYEVQTANGTARAASAKIDSVQIGRIAIDNVEALVLEDSALTETLVGLSFLKRLSKYQVQDGTLILAQ